MMPSQIKPSKTIIVPAMISGVILNAMCMLAIKGSRNFNYPPAKSNQMCG